MKPVIQIDDQVISETVIIKFLGFMIDEHLNWMDHVKIVQSKASSGLKNVIYFNPPTLGPKSIYFASINHSIISFGVGLYGNNVEK